MFFRSRCPTSALAAWCRALHHGLDVGLSPVRIFRQQARTGPLALRDVADRIAARLEEGDSISEALQPETGRFPVLFVESVAVGEQTGRLSDILGELEAHYTNLQQARSRLFVSMLWPGFSLFAAIGVITLMILIVGMIAPGMDPLGFGLTGTRGAVLFLIIALGIVLGVFGMIQAIASDEAFKSRLFGLALAVPGLAGCVRAFALKRFSLAWHFLAEAGLKADRTLAVALRATANRAYRAHETSAPKKIRKGSEVPEVLADCGTDLFPEEYVEAARVGEETGQLAEVMAKQARHYQEESERKLTVLTRFVGWAVYGVIALIIILAIRQILVQNSVMDPWNHPDLKELNRMGGIDY